MLTGSPDVELVVYDKKMSEHYPHYREGLLICVENDFRVNLFQSSLEIAIFRYLLSKNTPPDNCKCVKPLASSGIYIS